MSETRLGDKGVILTTGLAENVKVTLALWPARDNSGSYVILARPVVKRLTRGTFKTNLKYKNWFSIREVYALIATLQRASCLMEDYFEGTLDLTHILAEDEDTRLFTDTEGSMYPTIDGMFELNEKRENKEKEKL